MCTSSPTRIGIVHRDVTPSNIFVTYDGRVKLADFGMATATLRDRETRTGALKGDLAYMSPEVARNERLDRRSDIFSVGIMLWEAATGRRLWQGQEQVAIYRRLLTRDLSIYVPGAHGTSAEMLRIAQRALAVDPSQRYATAEQMRLDLEDLMSGLGKTTQRSALAEYMAAFFSAERQEMQTLVDEAMARFPSCATTQNSIVPNHARASSPPGSIERPTTISSPPGGASTFLSASSAYDIVEAAHETPNFRRGVYRGFGIAFTAVALATAIAYASRAPVGPSNAAVAAAGAPTTPEPSTTSGEVPSSANHAVAQLAIATPLPSAAMPRATTSSSSREPAQGSALTPAAAPAILAVFVARPANARLFLDGVPLDANPATIRREPDDKRHLLRVEAPGYTTVVRTIELARDVAKEVELAPEGTHGAMAPATGSAAGPRGEVPKTPPAKGTAVRDDPWGI
jgi:eukaryotic-like serine/threonine-protein kinase